MLKRLLVAVLLFCFAQQAYAASSTLGNLSAGSAVAGTDLFYDVQSVGSGGVKVTATQLTTYFQGSLKCGSTTNVCFNSSSTFGGDSGFTYTTPGQVAIALSTITTNVKALNITGTFNAAGTTFDAPLFMNITNTASATPSYMVDLQVGGSSQLLMSTAASLFLPIGGGVNGGNFQDCFCFGVPTGSNNAEGMVGSGASEVDFLVQGAIRGSVVPAGFYLGSGETLSWAGSSNIGDIALSRDGGAALLAVNDQSSKTTAVSLRVYNTTDTVGGAPTNYERGVLDWKTNSNVFTVGTQAGGSGSTRNMEFIIGGTNKLDYGVTTAGTWTMAGNFNAPGVASLSAATTAWLCWTTSTGAVSEDSTSCITSLRALKDNIVPLADATGALLALKPSSFTWKAPLDRNQQGLQFGFIAEDVEEADPRLASYSRDGKLHGWRQDSVIALLVRGFQEQQAEIEQLKRRASR